jgi:Tfp pilus assembly protein PilV
MAPRLTQRLSHRFGCAADSDSGFTVLEVVVAVTLFIIVTTASATAIIGNITASKSTQQRVRAANLAQSFLAEFQASKTLPSSLPTSGPDGYGVSVSLSPGLTSTCATGSTRTVTVLIWAPNVSTATGTPIARTDSVLAC